MAPDVSPVAKEVLLSLGLKFEMIKKKTVPWIQIHSVVFGGYKLSNQQS
jgi:hypothetical protein